MSDLSTPQAIQTRLEAIETDLAILQNDVEQAAMKWFVLKREREKARATCFLTAKGTDTARRMMAEQESAPVGAVDEARWEALKAKLKVLETRANIGMSLLRSQGRA